MAERSSIDHKVDHGSIDVWGLDWSKIVAQCGVHRHGMQWQKTPNSVYTEVAQSTAMKAENQRKRKATDESKRRRRESKYSRTDNSVAAKKAYSRHDGDVIPDDVVDDVSEEHLRELKESYYNNKVVVSKQEMERIEQNTKEQSGMDDRATEKDNCVSGWWYCKNAKENKEEHMSEKYAV